MPSISTLKTILERRKLQREISVTAAVELVDFVCVFFRNDLNLKPRDPQPKLKLAKTWKKHGKKRNLFHDFLQGGMLLFCFGGVVIVEPYWKSCLVYCGHCVGRLM